MRMMFVLMAGLLWSSHVAAQAADENCPELPVGASLGWEVAQGPDFVFCKAISQTDGSQAFSVMLGPDPVFRPDRALRDDSAVIDGHKVRWYRGDIATRRDTHVRETLVELGRRSNAHIVVRADSEDRLAHNRQLAESLRFRATAAGGD